MQSFVARVALRPCAWLGGLMLAMLVPLTVLDVLLRYLLNAPLRGTFEITQLAMVGVVFLGLGEAHARTEHITIDLVYERFGGRGRAILDGLSRVTSLALASVISWQLFAYMMRLGGSHEVSGVLGVPLALAAGMALAGFCVFVLALLVDA